MSYSVCRKNGSVAQFITGLLNKEFNFDYQAHISLTSMDLVHVHVSTHSMLVCNTTVLTSLEGWVKKEVKGKAREGRNHEEIIEVASNR